jgi:thiol-disulfide isomerase/thioredoxin
LLLCRDADRRERGGPPNPDRKYLFEHALFRNPRPFQIMQEASSGPIMRALAIAGLSTAAAAAMAVAFIAWRAAQPALSPHPAAAQPSETDQPPFIALQTPRPLPPLNFVNGDGAAMTLADFHGRIVLLNVWATWCVPCRKEMPALDRLQEKLEAADFAIVPLSIDHRGRDAVERFYRELGLTSLRIYLDPSGDAPSAINAFGMPTTLLIDRKGQELGRVIGAAQWDDAAMVSRIKVYLETNGRETRTDGGR